MPLVLNLRKGQDFYAGSDRFLVQAVAGPGLFRLRRESDGRLFEIDDTRAVCVAEDTYVSAGIPRDRNHVRVVVDAAPNIKIFRGEKLRHRQSSQ